MLFNLWLALKPVPSSPRIWASFYWIFVACNKIQDSWDGVHWAELGKSDNTKLSLVQESKCCCMHAMVLWLWKEEPWYGRSTLGAASIVCSEAGMVYKGLREGNLFQHLAYVLYVSSALAPNSPCLFFFHKKLVEPIRAKCASWHQNWDVKYVCQNFPGRMEIYSKCSTESKSIIL